MKKLTPLLITVFAALLGIIWFTTSTVRMSPALELKTLSGQSIHTLQRHNKPLLMTFWATSCVGCVKEIPQLIALQNDLNQQLDITGVAMSYDELSKIHEMIKRRQINYPVVYDASGNISKAFGDIKLTPTTFLISPGGEIVFQKIGDVDFALLRTDINNLINKKAS